MTRRKQQKSLKLPDSNLKKVLLTFLWVKIKYFDEPFSLIASGGFIVHQAN